MSPQLQDAYGWYDFLQRVFNLGDLIYTLAINMVRVLFTPLNVILAGFADSFHVPPAITAFMIKWLPQMSLVELTLSVVGGFVLCVYIYKFFKEMVF